MNTRAGHWADQPAPHRDWPEAGEDGRVSKAEREDRMPAVGNPTLWDFVWPVGVWLCLVVGVIAAAKFAVTGRVL